MGYMVISTPTPSIYLVPQHRNIPWTHQRTTSTRPSGGRARSHRMRPGELLDKTPSGMRSRLTQIPRLGIRIGMGLLTARNAAFTAPLIHSSLKVQTRVLGGRRLRSRFPWSMRPAKKLQDKISSSVPGRETRKLPYLCFGMGVKALMTSAKSCCHRNTRTIRRPPFKGR